MPLCYLPFKNKNSETREGYATCWLENVGLSKSEAHPLSGNIFFILLDIFFLFFNFNINGPQIPVTRTSSPYLFSYHLLFLLALAG